ncbi:Rv1733c family protein [Streptomyces sp. NPDC054834]
MTLRSGLWRWRRSPLRRTSDLVEAWLLFVAWAVGVLGGAAAGVTAAVVADRGFAEERSGRRQVAAVLLEDARDAAPAHADVSNNADATVRWTTRDGRTRTGRAAVPAHMPVGARVPVWTDSRGDLVSEPAGRSDAVLKSSLVGMGSAIATGCAVWGSARAARALLDRRRMKQWALEWERADARRGGATA